MNNAEDMAKAFLDQWQQQWSGLAADPAWQQMAQQQWQQFAQGLVISAPGMVNVPPTSGKVGDDPRAQTAAASSDLGAQLLAECFMRMARLEARVADLESGLQQK